MASSAYFLSSRGYSIEEQIGEGMQGQVFLAKDKKTEERFAIKAISSGSALSGDSILSQLDHPGIVKLKEILVNPQTFGKYFCMEYIDGVELFVFLENRGFKTEVNDAKRIYRQLAKSIHYLHQRNIVHRDIKLENVMITKAGRTKIIDFGFANLASKITSARLCGSVDYVSPELLNAAFSKDSNELDAKAYKASDVWALGVLFYTLVMGYFPFEGEDMDSVFKNIVDTPFPKAKLAHLPSELVDLLSKMLAKDVDERLTIAEVLEHPFFAKPKALARRSSSSDLLTGAPSLQLSLKRASLLERCHQVKVLSPRIITLKEETV